MSLIKVTSILCIIAVAESLTLNCPRRCIGAEIQLTCQSDAQNLKTFSWTYNGQDLSTDPRFNVTKDVDEGVSTLTFINLPFDNDTHIVCGEVFISGSGDRETCNFYVDPIPPVTQVNCHMISRYSLHVSWNEPPCLPKRYNYFIIITNKNTTSAEEHTTPKLFLTINNFPSCTDLVINVTVVHTEFNDSSTSVPTVKDCKVRDQKRNIRLNNSFYEYMNMGNSCFSLKFKIYSELYWLCQGTLYLTFDSSNFSQSAKFLPLTKSAQKVDVPIDEICMRDETEITVFIWRIDEKIEIVVYDHGAHDEDTILWNGGVVNVSSCTLRNNNTSLTGTGCYSEGVLIMSNWSSSFVIFNDNNTAALFVFNVTIPAQSPSPTSPSIGSTPSPPGTNYYWCFFIVLVFVVIPIIICIFAYEKLKKSNKNFDLKVEKKAK